MRKPMLSRRGLEHAAGQYAHECEFRANYGKKTGPRMAVMAVASCKSDHVLRAFNQLREPDPTRVLDDFTLGYVECMIWSSVRDDDEDSVTDEMGWGDLSVECKARVLKDCREFQAKAQERGLDLGDYAGPAREHSSEEMAGHDFWLTREGHGAGFWDGDWPEELGEQLTKLSKKFGETWGLYVDDAGEVNFLG